MDQLNQKKNYQPDGLLLVDKPTGWTSHDVVKKIKNYFQLKKVGHAGTLDPMATGLLILLIGKATKLSGSIMSSNKIYDGTIKLGVKTTTQDVEGEIIETSDTKNVSIEDIKESANSFLGSSEQVPPMVSAIKKNGIPLYKLARKGITVERAARVINIFKFEIHSYLENQINFTVECTKGTYVRTLANDLGEKIGCYACLSSLRRISSGEFNLTQSYKLSDLLEKNRNDLNNLLLKKKNNII